MAFSHKFNFKFEMVQIMSLNYTLFVETLFRTAPPETDAEVPPPAEENKETQSKTSEEKTETKTPEKSTTGKKKSKKKSFKTTSGGKGFFFCMQSLQFRSDIE